MDEEKLARELIRALRGKRSQMWLARRLGLRSNLVYRWEAGRAYPSAEQFFASCVIMRAGDEAALERFVGGACPIPRSMADTAALLRQLSGGAKITALARELGESRFVVSRWLSGKTQIRLPELLRFVHLTTARLLDFCAVFMDPARLASVAPAWRRLQAARRAAYDVPWSHGVLRALELRDYQRATGSNESWIARRLGIAPGEVRSALTVLEQSGQLKRRGKRYVVVPELIDTRSDRQRRQGLRSFWTRVALERLEQGATGIHAFNLFAVAERDLPKLRALHGEMFEKMRAVIARSAPSERVVLYSAQMLELDQAST